MAHQLPDQKKNVSSTGGRGIRRGNCRLWRPPRYSARSFTFPVPHQWPIGGRKVQSKTLRRWLPVVPEHQYTPRPHHPAGRHETPGGLGQEMGDAQKCYILSSRSKSTHMYSLNGVFLKQVQQHPYLGVIISDDLKWGKHIAYISRKAGATVGFLHRNLRNCPKECRRLAYIALVRSRLEYAEIVWNPYYQQDIEKLERVQRQAACFITKDYRTREPGCVNRMLQDLTLPPLAERRRQARLGLMYKITGGLIPAIPPPPPPPSKTTWPQWVLAADRYDPPSRRTLRPQTLSIVMKSEILNCLPTTQSNTKTFFIRTVVDWNHLEENIIKAGSASAFTSVLSRSTPPAS